MIHTKDGDIEIIIIYTYIYIKIIIQKNDRDIKLTVLYFIYI